MKRDEFAMLNVLGFVTEGSSPDYWDFVTYCRNGLTPHRFRGNQNYDLVFGPVSLWPQTLVVKDCDQISFHAPAALMKLPAPTVQYGNPFV
jgi:hypothetical protein